MTRDRPLPRPRGRPPGSKSGRNPIEKQKRTLFERALNRHARKSIKKLKEALEDIEEMAALEVMALRLLLRAAEKGDPKTISLILGGAANDPFKKVAMKERKGVAPAEPDPDLPDPSEFDA